VKNRVLAYINRCSANTHKGDLDRQSPIATEAIRLDPSRAALKAMMFAFTGERPWRSNFVDTLISSEGISISLLLITRKSFGCIPRGSPAFYSRSTSSCKAISRLVSGSEACENDAIGAEPKAALVPVPRVLRCMSLLLAPGSDDVCFQGRPEVICARSQGRS
jgi:hypothetical protein